jgi:hypothetical protein
MTTEDIKVLADSEMETGRSLAIGLGIVSIASLVIIGSFTFAVIPDLLSVVFLLAVGFGAAGATGALFWAWRRRNRIIAMFVAYALPAPVYPTLPQAEIDEKPETEDSRGGYAERKLHGIPAITWEWMCNYIVKNSWAEERLESVQVPYMYPITYFGKAQGNTVYTQMFHSERGVFIRAGIVGGRVPKQKGNLLIDNPVEMMELIKALSEE